MKMAVAQLLLPNGRRSWTVAKPACNIQKPENGKADPFKLLKHKPEVQIIQRRRLPLEPALQGQPLDNLASILRACLSKKGSAAFAPGVLQYTGLGPLGGLELISCRVWILEAPGLRRSRSTLGCSSEEDLNLWRK